MTSFKNILVGAVLQVEAKRIVIFVQIFKTEIATNRIKIKVFYIAATTTGQYGSWR